MEIIRPLPIMLMILALPSVGLHADTIDSKLRQDIFGGWAELEIMDGARTAIDATILRQVLEGPKKGSETFMFQYRRNGNTARLSGGSEDRNEIVLNSQYLFYVGREAPFQPWTLRLVELDLASNTARKFQESGFDPLIVAPTSVLPLGSFLSQQRKPSSLADDPKFKLTKTERLPDGLVKVHYRYDHANYKLSGEFDCDPATHFVIRSGRSRHGVRH